MKVVTKTSRAAPAVEQLNLDFERRAKPKEAASPKRLIKRLRTETLEKPKE